MAIGTDEVIICHITTRFSRAATNSAESRGPLRRKGADRLGLLNSASVLEKHISALGMTPRRGRGAPRTGWCVAAGDGLLARSGTRRPSARTLCRAVAAARLGDLVAGPRTIAL